MQTSLQQPALSVDGSKASVRSDEVMEMLRNGMTLAEIIILYRKRLANAKARVAAAVQEDELRAAEAELQKQLAAEKRLKESVAAEAEAKRQRRLIEEQQQEQQKKLRSMTAQQQEELRLKQQEELRLKQQEEVWNKQQEELRLKQQKKKLHESSSKKPAAESAATASSAEQERRIGGWLDRVKDPSELDSWMRQTEQPDSLQRWLDSLERLSPELDAEVACRNADAGKANQSKVQQQQQQQLNKQKEEQRKTEANGLKRQQQQQRERAQQLKLKRDQQKQQQQLRIQQAKQQRLQREQRAKEARDKRPWNRRGQAKLRLGEVKRQGGAPRGGRQEAAQAVSVPGWSIGPSQELALIDSLASRLTAMMSADLSQIMLAGSELHRDADSQRLLDGIQEAKFQRRLDAFVSGGVGRGGGGVDNGDNDFGFYQACVRLANRL